MTKEILQSDVDLAERLINAHSPDSETITALVNRGLELAKATRLVHDLRCGLPVKPERVAAEPVARKRRRSHRALRPRHGERPVTFEQTAWVFQRPQRKGQWLNLKETAWMFLVLCFGAVLVSLILGLIFFVILGGGQGS